MEYKDYYKILGVNKKATSAQIKKEYRKLARKYHPDVNKDSNAEQKFKEVGEAYEVLKDPEKRKAYDQYGSSWKAGKERQHQQQQQGAGFGGEGFDFGGGFDGSGDYSDFFESLFGGGRGRGGAKRQSRSQKGEDIDASITVPLTDAYEGSTRRINFTVQSMTPEGQLVNKPLNLNVKIPKGIKNGQKIRLKGQGAPGHNGGETGDMYIKVEFEKNQTFDVKGSDVYVNLPLAPWEAALGATINVPSPVSNIKVKIPAGSAQGKKLRLKGKGIPAKAPGDLYVVINIVLPPANDKKARKVYEEMKDLNFNPRVNFGR
ncbi:MAG: DnaJ C-terminal domain-containing protein [Bacteroidales bacterium]|nr:DnaJ C-terminal domain-containing protein [Bacteroidales bacterium]